MINKFIIDNNGVILDSRAVKIKKQNKTFMKNLRKFKEKLEEKQNESSN